MERLTEFYFANEKNHIRTKEMALLPQNPSLPLLNGD